MVNNYLMNTANKYANSTNEAHQLDLVFKALSDQTRRAQLRMLAQSQLTISELAKPFDMSLPAASKHLKILQRAGLINCEKVGRIHHCQINQYGLENIQTWLNHYQSFWQDSLQSLAELVEQK